MSLDTITHQEAALARLAQFLRDKPNASAVLEALTNRAQEVEVAFQDLLSDRAIATAVGAQLDVLGAIVGQVRGGLSDTNYRIFISARIKINRSSGTGPELLDVFALLFTVSSPGATLRLRDEPPAAFTLEFNTEGFTTELANFYVTLLRIVRAAGVRGLMEYGESDADAVFTFDGTGDQAFENGKFRGTLI